MDVARGCRANGCRQGCVIPAGRVPRTPKQGRTHRLMSSQTRESQHVLDWEAVRTRSSDSPFARAFFTLVEGFDIVESEGSLPA